MISKDVSLQRSFDMAPLRSSIVNQTTSTATVTGCWHRRKRVRLLCHLFLVLLAIVYASLLWVGTSIQKQFPLVYPNEMLTSVLINYPSRTKQQQQKEQKVFKKSSHLKSPETDDNLLFTKSPVETPSTQTIDTTLASSSMTSNNTNAPLINLWEEPSSRLPRWMKDYFSWHHQQRALLNSTHWKHVRYMVLQCRHSDERCGGTADRIKPLPYMVLIAAQTRRLLLIKWERPHALDEFLVPPQGGIDWRMPDYLVDKLWNPNRKHNKRAVSHRTILQRIRDHPTEIALCTKYQSSNSGEDYYDEHRRQMLILTSKSETSDNTVEPTFVQVYPEVWRIFFTPSPPIAHLITQQLHQLQLMPLTYVAAHIRANYGKFGHLNPKVTHDHYLKRWSKACIHCASQLVPHAPILVVSDSVVAVNMTLQYSRTVMNDNDSSRVVARLATTTSVMSAETNSLFMNSQQLQPKQKQQQQRSLLAPLHLEKTGESLQRPPSDYYDTFVDLYLMAMARCVVYNIGGFGHWAMLIGSWNRTSPCGLQYYDIFTKFHPCETANISGPTGALIPKLSLHDITRHSSHLLLPPMTNNSIHRHHQATNPFTPRYYPLPVNTAVLDNLSNADGSISKPRGTSSRQSATGDTLNMTMEALPWENSTILPDWIKDYFRWHRDQRRRITMDNWRNFKYIVVRCRKTRRCGGTADRLKPLPFFVLIAHQSKRILMINWERPKPLEDFLVPPQHGIDWRVPDFLVWKIARDNYPKNTLEKIQRAMNDTQALTLTVRYQSYNSGADYYDQLRPSGPTFAAVYHELWHAVFTPAPPIAKRIEAYMQNLGLVPGQYVAVHVRSNYTTDPPREELELWTNNSINCASQMMPGTTIFFASDSSRAIDFAKSYGEERNARVVFRTHETPPLHLEKAMNWETRPASDYYDTFVDLYLLGMSRCVTYNQGGFGSWASLISFNSSCSIQHHQANGIVENCGWKTANDVSTVQQRSKSSGPLFAESMPYPKLWDTATTIPDWMKDYFDWHAEEMATLNATNWESRRFLISSCLKEDIQCGGVSDRLKPLPLLLLIAYRTKRLLMIWWERPGDLEEFMVPPKGGLDWRIPAWLRPVFSTESKLVTNQEGLLLSGPEPTPVLRLLYQSGNAGSTYFNQTEDAKTTYDKVFHELFRIVFTPSPALAEVIEETMKHNKLTPGEYASSHLRAMYGRSYRDPEEVKHLAINAALCASKMRPGGPVYFAADSKLSIDSVRNYAKKHSLPIITFEYEGEALHLDKDSKNESLAFKPADFFPTFVDLYMLAQSKCVAYSNGGFGTFGLALSYNSSCSLRHFRRRRATQICRWQGAIQKK